MKQEDKDRIEREANEWVGSASYSSTVGLNAYECAIGYRKGAEAEHLHLSKRIKELEAERDVLIKGKEHKQKKA